jgi:predicted nucleic acid-binding protein
MLVIDASAALYLLASADGIEPFTHLGLAAPALLWSEVTSVLNEMHGRGELSTDLAEAAFDRLMSSPIERHTGDQLYRDAREVGRQLGWAKTCDAEYVALARLLRCRLLTTDAKLRTSASKAADVVGPTEL